MSHFKLFLDASFFRISLVFLFFVLTKSSSYAQGEWAEYLLTKDKHLMSIQVDMEFDYEKPNYKNLLIVGKTYKGCLKNGFPNAEGLNNIYTFSDATENELNKMTKNKLVGIITYNCIGLDIYYIKDTINIRDGLESLHSREFDNGKRYLYLKKDRNREYYYNNLFPPDLSSDFFLAHEHLIELANAGDKLNDKRLVTHWAYFKNLKKRNKFEKNIKAFDFQIDSITINKDDKYPYHLQFSKESPVDPKSVINLTNMIKFLVYSTNSIYGGWEFDPKTEE